METPFNNRSWTVQGFEILDNNNKVTDAKCRFLFRGLMISVSSQNYSRSSTFNPVHVYQSVQGEKYPYSEPLKDRFGNPIPFRTLQHALDYIVDMRYRPKHNWDNFPQKD